MKPRSYYKNDGQDNDVKFDPPLWKQRRNFIENILRRFAVESVLDYGCGEAAVLSFLISPNGRKITRLAGIDLDSEALQDAIERCEPWEIDYKNLRNLPLTIDIYQGSIGIPDDRFKRYEAIVCTEVIEHVYPEVLDTFFELTLNIYKPKVLIVTTPNAEYNINFPDLMYGTAGSIFRHDDHEFEWTRSEFQTWCETGAERYGYNVEFHGIGLLQGKEHELQNGHCTQACVFINPNYVASNPAVTTKHGEPHRLLRHFEFPYYDEPPLSTEEIAKELKYYVELLCRSEVQLREDRARKITIAKHSTTSNSELDSLSFDTPFDWANLEIADYLTQPSSVPKADVKENEKAIFKKAMPVTLPISDLWDSLRIQQICQSKAFLLKILSDRFDDALDYTYDREHNNLIVYKPFKTERYAK